MVEKSAVELSHKSHFFVAGAIFGEVGVSLFVAVAAFREILGDSQSAKFCIFPYKMRLQGLRTGRVRDFMVGSCLDHARIVFTLAETIEIFCSNLELRLSWQAQYLVMLEGDPVAPRIVMDVSCLTSINHQRHFSWQAQYLVMFGG